jgi:hypothetical protein
MTPTSSSFPISSLLSFSFFIFFFAIFTFLESSADCSQFDHAPMTTLCGGIHDSHSSQNSAEIESLARFAVDQHNTKQVSYSFSSIIFLWS